MNQLLTELKFFGSFIIAFYKILNLIVATSCKQDMIVYDS